MIVISLPQQIIPARDPKQCREAKRYCTLSVMIKNYGEAHDENIDGDDDEDAEDEDDDEDKDEEDVDDNDDDGADDERNRRRRG